MSKLMEKLSKKYRRRHIRHAALAKLKPMLKRWSLTDGVDCAEQGEGALDTQELLKIERMRRQLKKTDLQKYAEAKEEAWRERIKKREARCRKSL